MQPKFSLVRKSLASHQWEKNLFWTAVPDSSIISGHLWTCPAIRECCSRSSLLIVFAINWMWTESWLTNWLRFTKVSVAKTDCQSTNNKASCSKTNMIFFSEDWTMTEWLQYCYKSHIYCVIYCSSYNPIKKRLPNRTEELHSFCCCFTGWIHEMYLPVSVTLDSLTSFFPS